MPDQSSDSGVADLDPRLSREAGSLIDLARRSSVGLPPRPRGVDEAVLAILVGDPDRIEPLLIDYLAEAAILLGAKSLEIDRDLLGDQLAVQPYVVDGALDQQEPTLCRLTKSVIETVGRPAVSLRLIQKEAMKGVMANLAGALQEQWHRLDLATDRQPTRNQFLEAIRRLLPSRVALFGGETPTVIGLVILPMKKQSRLVGPYRSAVARGLQRCIKTSPGATTVAERYLTRQAERQPGRRSRVVDIEERPVTKVIVKTKRRRKAQPPQIEAAELVSVERRDRAARRLKDQEKKTAQRAAKVQKKTKPEETTRLLRIDRRHNRKRHLNLARGSPKTRFQRKEETALEA